MQDDYEGKQLRKIFCQKHILYVKRYSSSTAFLSSFLCVSFYVTFLLKDNSFLWNCIVADNSKRNIFMHQVLDNGYLFIYNYLPMEVVSLKNRVVFMLFVRSFVEQINLIMFLVYLANILTLLVLIWQTTTDSW